MLSIISFPELGLEFNPDRVAFSVFGKDIYWYGIIIAVGFFLAVWYAMKRAPKFGLTQDNVLDMLLAAVPLSIVCARAYYCIFYWEKYQADPIRVFYIWEGGIAIYGAVIGAVIGAVLICKIRKIPLLPMLDIGGLGLLIGQMIGRWGNFINREAFGAPTDSFLRMGLSDIFGNTTYYHPTFLYESLWNLIGFVVLHFYSKRRKFDGEVFTLYLVWYGLGRAWIEGLREDSLYLFGTGIRVSQLVALASFALGVIFVSYIYITKKPKHENLHVYKCAENTVQETEAETEVEVEE